MERYFDINDKGHSIKCKIYCNNIKEIQKVVIFGHGFAGHKDNAAASKFAERVLSKYKGIAVLTYNLPCHGDDVKKKMILADCETYLQCVIDYVNKQLNVSEIYAYATSFGAYLVLKYVNDNGNPFKKIALRSPAVCMGRVMTRTIMGQEDCDKLKKGKPVKVGFDRKIDITQQFLDDLIANDIKNVSFIDYADDILIIHGNKDEVAPFWDAFEFAEDNVIEMITVEGADHRFQNPKHMETATKAVIDFFGW